MNKDNAKAKYDKSNRILNRCVWVTIFVIVMLRVLEASGGGEGGLVVGGIIFGFVLLPCNIVTAIFSVRSVYLYYRINRRCPEMVSIRPAMSGVILFAFEAIIVILNHVRR